MCNKFTPHKVYLVNCNTATNTCSDMNDDDTICNQILSTLSDHIAVIDQSGTIVAVNLAWKKIALENGITSLHRCDKGSNYYDVCRKSIDNGDTNAELVMAGIQSVFRKEKPFFELEYPFDTPVQKRWFIMNAMLLQGNDTMIVLSHHDITQRKACDEAITASEEKYRRLFESAMDGILILDVDTGQITDVNNFLINILGYQHNEFLGKELWEFGFFIDKVESKKAFEQLKIDKYIRYENLPLRNKSGKLINVEFVSNVYEASGKKVIQCNIRDITMRVNAEEELRVSEAQYKLIVENAHEGICIIDENNNNAFINQTLSRMLGYETDEMVGKSVFDSMAEEEMTSMSEHTAKRKSGISELYEIKLRRKNGEPLWTLIGSRPIIKNNVYKGALVMVLDISEKKNKDLELIKLTNRLQLATQAAKFGVWDLDIANNKLIWDHGMYLITGLNPHNYIPTWDAMDSIIHPEDRERRKEEIEMALKGKKVFNMVFRILWPDKSIHYIKADGIVEYDDAGRAVRMIGTNQDITHLKISEIETFELVKQLKLKNRDLRQFAYIVSHNLRAPIVKIQGLAFIISNPSGTKKMKELMLQSIVEEANNLDTVVKDMNDILSVQDTGSKKFESVSFQDKTDMILNVLDTQVHESKAIITTDFHEIKQIITVNSYLYSIMYNLVSNALKYRSPERQLSVQLKTFYSQDMICLSVKDNGMGIDLEKNADKVFGLYKRFHGKNIPGKGIGLNLVKMQAESMGGIATVISTKNKGSEFIIYLPLNPLTNETS